jgi:hypothetical protein
MSYHDEIRELLAGIEDGALAEGGIYPGIEGIKTHAERLLALPEASIEMLVQAAQLGVGAVEAALADVEPPSAREMMQEHYPDGVHEHPDA